MKKRTKRDIFKDPYPFNFLEIIAYDGKAEMPEEWNDDILDGIQYSLSSLSKLEQEIIRQRYEQRKNYAEIAIALSETKEKIHQFEKTAILKLQSPYHWNTIRYGIRGNMKIMADRAYKRGYEDGYRSGVHDERKGLVDQDGNPDPMRFPISDLRLSPRSLTALKKAGFTKLGEIAFLRSEEIEKIKYLGSSGKSEIAYALHRLGIDHTAWSGY